MSYLMYLRKSRADKEAELRGEGETLARHEQILSEFAAKMDLPIGAIYKEIVSGETISSRPKMQQLLIEVMQGHWDGVLVMEIERLARGDAKDQGTVAEAFKFSNTKIITPIKTYDPLNEYDEEYFEFNLFMSRREYKTINRRIQRGRIAAFNDGWYIAGTAPYGYKKVKRKGDKGYTLDIVDNEAQVVRMIYDLYTHGELQDDGSYLRFGSYQIKDRLNDLHIQSRSGSTWSAAAIIDILRNPAYAGYQRWSWRKVQKKLVGGNIVESRPKNDDCSKVKGRFEAIITDEQFELAQKIREGKPTPIRSTNALQNPLSGLVYCEKCGTLMTRQPSNTKDHYPVLRCPNSKCTNISAPLYLIEQKLIEGLAEWADEYELNWPKKDWEDTEISTATYQHSVDSMQGKLDTITKQLSAAYDLLEQGIYTLQVFQERRSTLEKQKEESETELQRLNRALEISQARARAKREFLPTIRHIVDTYWTIDDVLVKNTMLKEVLEKVDYLKTERNKKGGKGNANFSIYFYPRVPKY